MHRQDLLHALDTLLQPDQFHDYGPNGLQVEGRADVHTLVSGVTASRALIEAAIAHQADAIVVHHGLFWRGQSGTITGWMKQRLALLLQHDINLYAYHLPLDAHPTLGNNAQLAAALGLVTDARVGEQQLLCIGHADAAIHPHGLANAAALAAHVQHVLQRPITCVGDDANQRPIRTLAWCSGGAQGQFEAAIAAGADAYLTGEISEPQAHLARECGVAFLACGHHATERLGAPALASHIATQHGLQHVFIDIPNPA